MKKIALVGASCTGKTTLFEALRTHYADHPQIAFAEEAARKYFSEHITPDHLRRTVKVQWGIMQAVMANEAAATKPNTELLICDRSLLDAHVFTYTGIDKKGAEALFQKVLPQMASYTKFYILNPADVPYKTDGIRLESEAVRMQIHANFMKAFEKYQLNFELISGTIQEKLQKIVAEQTP